MQEESHQKNGKLSLDIQSKKGVKCETKINQNV